MERRLSVHKVSDWWAKYDEIMAKLTCLVTYNGSAWIINTDCFPDDFEQIKKDVSDLGFRDIIQFCESFPNKFLVKEEAGAPQTNENSEENKCTSEPQQSSDTQQPNIDDETRALLSNYNPVPPSMRGEEKKREMESSAMPPPISEKKSDCVHFKFSHAEKTRRFAFPRDDQNLIGAVKGKVEKIVEKRDPNLFWRDEDSLCVLENGDDMEAAIDYADHQRTPACVVLEATGGKEQEEAKEEVKEEKKEETVPTKPLTQLDSQAAFNGFAFVCDGCDGYLCPSSGGRFKCLVCVDFDLCLACVAKGAHANHALVRLLNQETIIPARDGDGAVIYVQLKEINRCTPFFVADGSDVKKPKETFEDMKAIADEKRKREEELAEKKLRLKELREERKRAYRANLMEYPEGMHEARRFHDQRRAMAVNVVADEEKRRLKEMRDERKTAFRRNLMEHPAEMYDLKRVHDQRRDMSEAERARGHNDEFIDEQKLWEKNKREELKKYRASLMTHADNHVVLFDVGLEEQRRQKTLDYEGNEEETKRKEEIKKEREERKQRYRAHVACESWTQCKKGQEERRKQCAEADKKSPNLTSEMLETILRECGVAPKKVLDEKEAREKEEKRKARDELKMVEEMEKEREQRKELRCQILKIKVDRLKKHKESMKSEHEKRSEKQKRAEEERRPQEEEDLRALESHLEEERVRIEAEEKAMVEEQRRIIEELAVYEEMKREEERKRKLREDEAKLADLEQQLAIEKELLAKQKEEELKQKESQEVKDFAEHEAQVFAAYQKEEEERKKKMIEEDARIAAQLDVLFREQAEKERIDFFRKNPDYPPPLDIADQVAQPDFDFKDLSRRIEEVQEQRKTLVNLQCKRMEEGKKYDEFEEMEREEWERELSEAMMNDEEEEEEGVTVEDENLKAKTAEQVEPHRQATLEALKQVEIEISEEEVDDVSVERENLKARAAVELERIRAETDKLIMEALLSTMVEGEPEKPRQVEIDMNEDSDFSDDEADPMVLENRLREVEEEQKMCENAMELESRLKEIEDEQEQYKKLQMDVDRYLGQAEQAKGAIDGDLLISIEKKIQDLEELKNLHKEVTKSLNRAESAYGTPLSGLEQKDGEIEVREREEEKKKEDEYDRLSDASGSPVHSIEMVEAEETTEEKKDEKNDLWNAYESWKEEVKKEEKERRESSSIGSDIEIIDKLIEESDSVLETMHVLESKFDQLLLQPLVETSTSSSTTSSGAPESSTSSLHFPSVPTTTPTVSSTGSSASSRAVLPTPAPSSLPYPGVVVYLPTAPLQPAPAVPAPLAPRVPPAPALPAALQPAPVLSAPTPSAPVEEPVDPIPQNSWLRQRVENWETNELGQDVPTSSNQLHFLKLSLDDIENIVLLLEHKIAVELHQMPRYLDVPARIQRYCNNAALRGFKEHAPIFYNDKVIDDRMISRIAGMIETRLGTFKSVLCNSNRGMDEILWSTVCKAGAKISNFSDDRKYKNLCDELYNLLLKDDSSNLSELAPVPAQLTARPVPTRAWSQKVELDERQQRLLTELFDSDIFSNEHYERMVQVCLTARDLEQAIDMMLSYEW